MVMIGLECHVQIKSDSKIFCDSPTINYLDKEANTNICPICTAQPGAKPMALNRTALENVLKIALALECKLEKEVMIQRKHYFYPDLPSGYQRTSKPIGKDGKLGKIRIREVHIEEDPGRYELRSGTVDYNRAGIPLIEIVTEPDFTSPEEARAFLEELVAILGYLDVGRSEPGSSRIDANISLPEGARVEVKNINSFKGVYTALTYEIMRQQNMVKRGAVVQRETRHFDEAQGITLPMRKKETEEDYRYFPDPDVAPVEVSKEMVESVRKKIPELPRAKADRFMSKYGIRPEDAWILVSEIDLADLFEGMAKKFDPKPLALWLRGPLKKQLNYRDLSLGKSGLKTAHLEELYALFTRSEITDKGMENILIALFEKKKGPKEIAKELDLLKILDMEVIEKALDKVLKANPKAIEDYKKGEEKVLNFLVGQVVKETKGKVDSKTVRELILKEIG